MPTTALKGGWIDFTQKVKKHAAKEYELNSLEQQKLISKFASFTFEKNPYEELNRLKK